MCSKDEELRREYERVRAENAELRATLARAQEDQRVLQAILDSAPEGIAVADGPEGRFRIVSDEAPRLLGLPREEIVGAPGAEIARRLRVLHPDGTTPATYDQLPPARAIEHGEVVAGEEWVIERPDGSRIAVLANAGPIRDAQGEITGAVLLWSDISRLRQAEEALRESEWRHRLIVDNQTEFIVCWLPDGTRVYVNDAYCRYFGKTREELVGTSFFPLIVPEDQQMVREKIASITPEHPSATDEHRAYDATGQVRWQEWTDKGIFDEEGRLVEMYSVGRDVTDRKCAEEALRESEERYRRLVELSPDAIALHAEGKVLYINPAGVKLLGASTPQQIVGKGVGEFVHPDYREIVQERVRRMIETGESIPLIEEKFIRVDGSVVDVEVTATPTTHGGRRVVQVVARDITDRKRAEEALRYLAEANIVLGSSLDYEDALERTARLAVPFLADYCIIDVLDQGGQPERVATAAYDESRQALLDELRRYPPDPEKGEGVPAVLRTGEHVLLHEVSDAYLQSIARDDEHLRILRQLGIRSAAIMPMVVHGRTLGAITLLCEGSGRCYAPEDVPLMAEVARRAAVAVENARLHTQLREANEAKDRFIAVLSHELRNPLAPILAGVQVLRRLLPEEERVRRALDAVERNAKLQARLIGDLLDLSRITRGRLEFKHERVSLDAIVRSAAEDYRSEAERAGLPLRTNITPGLTVLGDLDRLRQAVSNLLANAVKFTPSGGEIRVTVREADGHACVAVADTGIGMDRALMEHLFEMFYQAKVGGGRPGLGIGLALVKLIVEHHGGRVWAESEGPGRGSRFTVELPLAAPPEVVAAGEREAAVPEEEHLKVLLVEDNPDTLTLIADGLEIMGYEVSTARSGEDALASLREKRPDIILSDIGLDGMDGYELLRRARDIAGVEGTPAFALTGWGQDEDIRRSREAGYTGHFIKPVDLSELDKRIRQTVRPPGSQPN